MEEGTWALDRQNIRDEIALLQKRLVVLMLFDHLFDTNPPFFDEENCEIVEPYNSFLQVHTPLVDGEEFITELEKIWMKSTEEDEEAIEDNRQP